MSKKSDNTWRLIFTIIKYVATAALGFIGGKTDAIF